MKLAVGLIHNNEHVRTLRSRRQIEFLLQHITSEYDTIVFEVVFQPSVISMSYEAFLEKENFQKYISSEWDHYRNLGQSSSFFCREPNEQNLRRASIELILTDKHLRCWDQVLEHAADWVLIMEDDAIFTDETVPHIKYILRSLNAVRSPMYVDLGGGYPLSSLKVETLISHQAERLVTFRRPVTNTACCYFLNQHLVYLLKSNIVYNPKYRLIAFDWLLNKCFIDFNKSNLQVDCIHFFPPIMIHGSMSGSYKSTVQI